ncbi:ComEA family DNA-binding protein [Castellaniella sp.]|uniref:ComEA family DNA-binding protein n=1 Tax=Castellaniella sp. TaxID=1955812 RepID=UPI002AFE6077|nr:helix-hairpin-helix domain-containing protein [Castellaniella sp.]
MNPFLHDTVARPSVPTGIAGSRGRPVPASLACALAKARAKKSPYPSPAVRLSRVLGVAGLAAMAAWAGAAGAVDLNTATLDQLRGIRGIGPKTAQIILEERSRGGSYVSFADLSDRVRGIGPRRAQALQSAGLTIDGGGSRLSGQGKQAANQVADDALISKPRR